MNAPATIREHMEELLLPAHTHEKSLPPSLSQGTRALGQWGEMLAEEYLGEHGYQLLERNWRCAHGELDRIFYSPTRQAIIALEVKTRRSTSTVPSIESMSRAKLERLKKLLRIWAYEKEAHAPYFFIDFIAITCIGQQWRLEHIEAIQ